MPYTGDPANSATDRLRLRVGDTDPFEEELSDAEYQYFLDSTTTEDEAYVAVLRTLVAKYAQYTRERAGQVEVYGQDRYKNYKQLLDDTTSGDPRKGLGKIGPGISGGVSKERIKIVRANPDSNSTDTYRGWSNDPDYISEFQEED